VHARTPAQRLVVRSRRKEYPYRPRANVVIVRIKARKTKKEYRDDPGGEGEEIVQEITVCPACAARNGEKQSVDSPL
jgi:hypothetical protein